MSELKVFSGSAVFSVQGAVHGRAQVEFGLHVLYVGEPDIYTVRLEKLAGEQVVGM